MMRVRDLASPSAELLGGEVGVSFVERKVPEGEPLVALARPCQDVGVLQYIEVPRRVNTLELPTELPTHMT